MVHLAPERTNKPIAGLSRHKRSIFAKTVNHRMLCCPRSIMHLNCTGVGFKNQLYSLLFLVLSRASPSALLKVLSIRFKRLHCGSRRHCAMQDVHLSKVVKTGVSRGVFATGSGFVEASRRCVYPPGRKACSSAESEDCTVFGASACLPALSCKPSILSTLRSFSQSVFRVYEHYCFGGKVES